MTATADASPSSSRRLSDVGAAPSAIGGAAGWALSLRLVRRELRVGLRLFRVFLACLALGVATIAAVQTLSYVALTSLEADAKPILGGDLALRQGYTPIPEAVRAWLAERGTVTHTITFRSMARPEDGALPGLVEAKAVEPETYPLYGALQTAPPLTPAAALAPVAGQSERFGALLEPGAAARLQLEVGEPFQLGDLPLVVTAILEREPDRLGGGGIVLAPRVMISQQALAASTLAGEGAMLTHGLQLRLPADSDARAVQRDLQQAFPQGEWTVNTYRNANSRLERLINQLTLYMTLVGLCALLVGGVGVSNAVRAFMDMKLRTIAILKSVGAPASLVGRVYLLQVTALALIGIAIGLALGAVLPILGLRAAEDLLPFQLVGTVYPLGLGLAAVFGLLITWTFSLWPIGQAQQVRPAALMRSSIAGGAGAPPRRVVLATAVLGLALAALAVATAFRPMLALQFVLAALALMAALRFAGQMMVRLAARIPPPPRASLRLALANLHRPGTPTPAVMLSLGLGLSVLVAIVQIRGNIDAQLAEDLPERAPAFFFVDIQPDQEQPLTDLITGIAGTERLVVMPQVRGRVVKVNGVNAHDAIVNPEEAWFLRGDRAFNYSARALYGEEETIAGQWWAEDYTGPPLLSVDEDVVAAFGIGLGDQITVEIVGREFTGTIAHIRDTNWRSGEINFALTFSPGAISGAPRTSLATVHATPAATEQILRQVPVLFPNVSAVPVREALAMIGEIIEGISLAITMIALLSVVSGALVLAGALAAERRQRIYDAVVLKVLGATRRDVLSAYLLQYGVLGVATALVAAVAGTAGAAAVVIGVLNVGFALQLWGLVLTLGVALGLTLGLGFLGTWSALSVKAAPMLRND